MMIKTKSMLFNALSEALGTMAFLDILPADQTDEALSMPKDLLLSEITFTGPLNGRLQFLANAAFGSILAENIAAIAHADDTQICDALKELSNVTCGLILPELSMGPRDVFDMTVPTVRPAGMDIRWDDFLADRETILFNTQGQALAVRLRIDPCGRQNGRQLDHFAGILDGSPLPNPRSIAGPNNMHELLGDFIESVNTQLDILEQAALEYESGVDRKGNAGIIRRILHKIKGEAGVVEIDDIMHLSHCTEDAFEKLDPDFRGDMVLRYGDWVGAAVQVLTEQYME